MAQYLFQAKLAERAERYDQMTDLMRAYMERLSGETVSQEARNLLSVAYKNCLSEKRTSWRLLEQVKTNEDRRGMKDGYECALEYQQDIQNEIIMKCDEIIQIVDKCSQGNDADSRAFYLKMKADYCRYIAELPTHRKEDAIRTAQELYDQALNTSLAEDHPLHLAITLNKAVFFYEVLGRDRDAMDLVETALATNKGGPLSIAQNKRNASVIMSLLYDNLQLWKSASAQAY